MKFASLTVAGVLLASSLLFTAAAKADASTQLIKQSTTPAACRPGKCG